jgi:hypothetical protein
MIGSPDCFGHEKLDGLDSVAREHRQSILEYGAASVIKGEDDASAVRTRILEPRV